MKISVLMSVYNTKNKYLVESIESVLNQTLSDFEFIIIDDGTNEENKITLDSYKKLDKRIKIISNKKNIGLTKSLNIGLKEAKGKYIARMDADDICKDNRFEKQYKYMESNPQTLVVGGIARVLGGKNIVMTIPLSLQSLKIQMIFSNCALAHPTAFMNAELLKLHNIKYDENIKKSQDYMLWSDCLEVGEIAVLEDVVLEYRIHEGQITKQHGDEQVLCSIEVQNKMMKKYFDYDMSYNEKKLHNEINNGKITFSISKVRIHLFKLIELNKQKQTFDFAFFERECYCIWLLMIVKSITKHGDWRGLLSPFTYRCIFNIKNWNYYFIYFKRKARL